MNTYVCQFFVLLPTFFFVRALFGKPASTRAHEARPDTLVQVSARSVHSGARGRRSKFFFRREWIRRFPLFQHERPYFVRTYTVNCCPGVQVTYRCMCLFSSHQVRNRQSQIDSIVPTPPPTHRACATHPYAQYCCGWLCLSEPAVGISPSALSGTRLFFIFFTYKPRLGFLYHHLSPCGAPSAYSCV